MIEQVETIAKKYANSTTDEASVLIFGSALNDDWTPKSDIDIFFISDSQKSDVEHITIDEVVLEIQKDNFETIMKNMEAERGSIRNRNLSTMIMTSEILKTSNSKQLDILKQKAEEILNSPTRYDAEDEKCWIESIKDYISKCQKDFIRNDTIAFQLDSTYVLQNIIDLFLAKHNSYLPQPKYLGKRLQSLDPTFASNFKKFTEATSFKDRLDSLKILSDTYLGA